MITLLLIACAPVLAPSGFTGGEPATDDTGDPVPPEPELSLAVSGAAALDPLLSSPCGFYLSAVGGETVEVLVTDDAGVVVATLADGSAWVDEVEWDGRDAPGDVAVPGPYLVTASLLEAGEVLVSDEVAIDVVRVGLTEGALSGERLPILWHLAGGPGMYWEAPTTDPTFTLSALEDEEGEAVLIPEVWADLDTPPEATTDVNLPAAFVYDDRPVLTLVVGGDLGGAEGISAQIDGWELVEGSPADGALVFQYATALHEGPGIVDEVFQVEWLKDGLRFAGQELPLRMYALLGEPAFDVEGAPYLPWVAIVDPALRAIDGVAPDERAVADALVEYVYGDLGLSYDTTYGASYYLSYRGGGYRRPHFDMTAFLERRNGSIVNCSDCAGILGIHANMLGTDLSLSIIQPSFQLNFIQAIGGSAFSRCPFGKPWGCGFSYHAVTTDDLSQTIWDATLALDGDADPGSAPSEVMMVQTVSGDEYLDRLVMTGNPDYAFEQKVDFQ